MLFGWCSTRKSVLWVVLRVGHSAFIGSDVSRVTSLSKMILVLQVKVLFYCNSLNHWQADVRLLYLVVTYCVCLWLSASLPLHLFLCLCLSFSLSVPPSLSFCASLPLFRTGWRTQGLMHAGQTLYHWATPPFLSILVWDRIASLPMFASHL